MLFLYLLDSVDDHSKTTILINLTIMQLCIHQKEYNPTVQEAWDDLGGRLFDLFATEVCEIHCDNAVDYVFIGKISISLMFEKQW